MLLKRLSTLLNEALNFVLHFDESRYDEPHEKIEESYAKSAEASVFW